MPQSALSSKNRETRFAWYTTKKFFRPNYCRTARAYHIIKILINLVEALDFSKRINIIVLTFISEVLYDFRQAIIGEG